MKYEFTADQNKVIKGVADRFRLVGALIALVGVASMITAVLDFVNNGSSLGAWALLFLAATQIITGVVLYRPSDNLVRVTLTDGKDIPELMTAFRELVGGLKIAFALGLIGTLLVILSNQ